MRMKPSEQNTAGLFTCPVCGYAELRHAPYNAHGMPDFVICPSCGVEYGYQDADGDHGRLRREWIANGMPWSSRVTPIPPDWDPASQLRDAGF